jgi:26S proteasome regulatory subunit T6
MGERELGSVDGSATAASSCFSMPLPSHPFSFSLHPPPSPFPPGSTRVEGSSGGDSEVQRTMLELLNQLDGFEPTQTIKVIMATNRIDILDSALLRPGRIDRKIEFPAPNEASREQILRIHSRKMNLMRGINLRKIATMLPTASGAECKAVCTEAGMFALRERRVHVTQEDFEMAVGKVMKKDGEKDMSILKLMS